VDPSARLEDQRPFHRVTAQQPPSPRSSGVGNFRRCQDASVTHQPSHGASVPDARVGYLSTMDGFVPMTRAGVDRLRYVRPVSRDVVR
jgi:hypothetical protein